MFNLFFIVNILSFQIWFDIIDILFDIVDIWFDMVDIWFDMVDIWFYIIDIWFDMVDTWFDMVDIWFDMVDIWFDMVDIWSDMVDIWFDMVDIWFDIWFDMADIWFDMVDIWFDMVDIWSDMVDIWFDMVDIWFDIWFDMADIWLDMVAIWFDMVSFHDNSYLPSVQEAHGRLNKLSFEQISYHDHRSCHHLCKYQVHRDHLPVDPPSIPDNKNSLVSPVLELFKKVGLSGSLCPDFFWTGCLEVGGFHEGHTEKCCGYRRRNGGPILWYLQHFENWFSPYLACTSHATCSSKGKTYK